MSSNDLQTTVHALPKNYNTLDLKSYKALVVALPAADRVEYIRRDRATLREEHARVLEARDKLQRTEKAQYTKREKLMVKDLGVLDRALQYFEGVASSNANPAATLPLDATAPVPQPAPMPGPPQAPPGLTRVHIPPSSSMIPPPGSQERASGVPAAPPGLTKALVGPTPGFPGQGPRPGSGVLMTPPPGSQEQASGAPAAPPGLTKAPVGPTPGFPGQGPRPGSGVPSLSAPHAPSVKAAIDSAVAPSAAKSEGGLAVGAALVPPIRPAAQSTPDSTPSSTAMQSVPASNPPLRNLSFIEALQDFRATVTRIHKRYDEPSEANSNSAVSAPPLLLTSRRGPGGTSTGKSSTASIPITGATATSSAPAPPLASTPGSQPSPVARTISPLATPPGLLAKPAGTRQAPPSVSILPASQPPPASMTPVVPIVPSVDPGRARGNHVPNHPPLHQKTGLQVVPRNTNNPTTSLSGLPPRAIPVRVKQEDNPSEPNHLLHATGASREFTTRTVPFAGTQPSHERSALSTTPLAEVARATATSVRPVPRPVSVKPRGPKREPDLNPAPLGATSTSNPSESAHPHRAATTEPPSHDLKTHDAPTDSEMRLATVKDEAELNNMTRVIQQALADAATFDSQSSKAQQIKRQKQTPKGGKQVPSKRTNGKPRISSTTEVPGNSKAEGSGQGKKRKRQGEAAQTRPDPVPGKGDAAKKRRVGAKTVAPVAQAQGEAGAEDGNLDGVTKKKKVNTKAAVAAESIQGEAEVQDGDVPEQEDDLKVEKGVRETVTEWGLETQYRIVDATGVPKPIAVRVLKPVDEDDEELAKILVEESDALHNHVTAGLAVPPSVLIRVRKSRHVLPELAALSRLSIIATFIHQSKLTRVQRPDGPHNNVRKFAVTGVPLRPSNEVEVPENLVEVEKRRGSWWDAYKKSYPHRLGSAPDLKTMPTTIGGLTKDKLLEFYRLVDGKYYLHCGCELDNAIFDFFIWKTMPPLVAPFTQTAECIGNPFDPRTRSIVISLLSSFGFGPHNLDSAFKYNREGKANDLSKAPAFIQRFWKERDAQAKAAIPVKPEPKQKRILEYLEVDELQGPVERDPFGEEEEEEEEEENMPKLSALENDSDKEDGGEIGAVEAMDLDDEVEIPDKVEQTTGMVICADQLIFVKQEVEAGELPQEDLGAVIGHSAARPLRETVEGGRTIFILEDSSDDEDPLPDQVGEVTGGLGDDSHGYDYDQSIMEVQEALVDSRELEEANMWSPPGSDSSALTDLDEEYVSGVSGDDDMESSDPNEGPVGAESTV